MIWFWCISLQKFRIFLLVIKLNFEYNMNIQRESSSVVYEDAYKIL